MKYRIYPSIGIARVGNSAAFFIGPEELGSPGVEITAAGESPVAAYKSPDFKTKRQAARFRIFQFDDDTSSGAPLALSPGTVVTWSVRLVNKKDAVQRSPDPPPPPAPGQPWRPAVVAGREDRVIDTRTQSVTGPDATSKSLDGMYRTTAVTLGAIQTDGLQRLIVLGGTGRSESPSNAPIGGETGGGDFYHNADWFDDVSDGTVTATIQFADGSNAIADPAWVVVAPPDFAPPVRAIVTLYDVIRALAVRKQWITLPATPSFEDDIRPLLAAGNALQWVTNGSWPNVLTSGPQIEAPDTSPAATAARRKIAVELRKANVMFSHPDQPYSTFRIQQWQNDYLDAWVNGNFVPGSRAAGNGAERPPADLTRAALTATIGQPFFPGIEAGAIVLDETIYAQPFDFRISDAITPGDVTALMALPWQADFLKCGTNWWPAQRPNSTIRPPATAPARWIDSTWSHRRLAADILKLGVVQVTQDAAGHTVMWETGRDPTA